MIVVVCEAASFLAFGEQQKPNVPQALTSAQARALEVNASMPVDHSRLADYYETQLRELAAKARYHQEMAERFRQNSLPFDTKPAVSMHRHCKEWAKRFDSMAERAAFMAVLHQRKAAGQATDPATLALFARSAVENLNSERVTASRIPPAGPGQKSFFQLVNTASVHFYERTELLTCVVDARGKPPVATPEMQQSANGLFLAHDQFLGSLSESQLAGIHPHILTMRTLRERIEKQLSTLEQQVARPGSRSQFDAARKLKQTLELWRVEQKQIGEELAIPGGSS